MNEQNYFTKESHPKLVTRTEFDKSSKSPFSSKRTHGFAFSGLQTIHHAKARASSELGQYREIKAKVPSNMKPLFQKSGNKTSFNTTVNTEKDSL